VHVTPLTDLNEANSKIFDLHAEIERLRAQLDLLRRQTFGQRREKIDPNQILLFDAGSAMLERLEKEAAEANSAAPSTQAVPKETRGHGRDRFSGRLPRQETQLDVPEADRSCPECGDAMQYVGTEVTERGHIILAQMVIAARSTPASTAMR
jgi:hypothetical protein